MKLRTEEEKSGFRIEDTEKEKRRVRTENTGAQRVWRKKKEGFAQRTQRARRRKKEGFARRTQRALKKKKRRVRTENTEGPEKDENVEDMPD